MAADLSLSFVLGAAFASSYRSIVGEAKLDIIKLGQEMKRSASLYGLKKIQL